MITSYSLGSPPVPSRTRPLSSWRVLETSCLTGMLSTTPETDSSSIGEPARTDDVWNVKLTCRKDTVFWNQKRPHRALSTKGIQKKMERYAKAAGLKASCHSLRHTFASNLLEEGAEVISIKELLGHTSMGSSERYAKLSNQRVKQVYLQTIRKVIAKTRV